MSVKKYSLRKDCNKKLAKNFSVHEFSCHNGNDEVLIDTELVALLQKIRDHFKKPMLITSAYRDYDYNRSISGAKNSYHVKGMAADVSIPGISNKKLAHYAYQIGAGGVGFYNYTGGFVHIDTRTVHYYWKQDSKNASYYTVSKQ